MNINLKYKDITGKIIGAAFEVHKFFGNGFQELIYQRALAIEMQKAGLEFAREIKQDIYYKDFPKPIGTRRADFVVAGKVLVELKAITELEAVHEAQLLNYLKVYRLEVGLLINFGEKKFNTQKTNSLTTQSRETQLTLLFFLNLGFSRIHRITRIFDAGVVKLYCVRLPKWYVHARERLSRCNTLKIRVICVIRLIRDSENKKTPNPNPAN